MARLCAEDKEVVSSLELIPTGPAHTVEARAGQSWQRYALTLVAGPYTLSLNETNCLLCRKPTDEIAELVGGLRALAAGESRALFFEPAEPSFELAFERMREGGIRVNVWIDASNASTGFYRWDAVGVRFYTDAEKLRSFTDSLSAEFAPWPLEEGPGLAL